jgi:hypothetical protein
MSNTDRVVQKLDQLLNVNLRMEKLLEKKDKGGDGKEGRTKDVKSKDSEDVEKIASLSTSMAELVKVLATAKLPDPKKGAQLARFVVNFAEGIEDAIKSIDEEKTKEFTKLIEVMMKGTATFVIQMALVAVITPIAMIGVAGFGLMILTLTKILTYASKVDKDTMKGIGALLGMGRGIALFMLVMVGITFVAPLVASGFLVFAMVVMGIALTLRVVDMIAGKTGFNPLDESPLGALAKLARGIALFTLTLILLTLTAPLIATGFLVFALVIMGIAVVLRIVSVIAGGGVNPTDKGPLGDLAKLGMGVALFAVTFVLISFVKERFVMGALIMLLTIAAFGLVLVGLSKMLRTGDKPLSTKGQFDVKDSVTGGDSTGPLADVLKLSKAVFIFSVTAIGVGYFAKQFIIGSIAIAIGLTAVGIVVDKVYGSDKVLQGSSNLRHVSLSLGIFVGVLALYALLVQPKLTWSGLGMLGAAIGVMGLVGTVLGIPPISNWVKAGAASLILLGGALTVFSIGLSIYAQLAADKLDWNKIGMLGAVIVGMGVAAGIIGAIEMSTGLFPITVGSAVMIVMGIALITFATGLSIYAQHAEKLTWDKIGILGGVITMLAVAGGAIGLVAPLVGLGAGALILLGLALIPLARGLSIFANADWTSADSEGLKNALHSIILGMFGYEKMSDIGIQAAVWIPSLIGFLLGTSAAFVVASKAMLPLSKALKIFKSTNWTMADSINLQFTLSGIANAFAKIAEGDNWFRTMLGIFGMRDVGGTLISLAAGIQAMANMTFTEYEWDETTKKLEPKRKVKLTKDDVKLAGDNAAYVISVLAEPLARFGAFVSGKASFMVNGVPLASDFMSVIMGISALGGLGKSLSSLSEGVQAWASMSYWEYDLVFNPQTGMKELKPSKKRKITPAEIKEAVTNIATVMTAMIVPVSAFGIMMAGGNLAGGPLAMLGITKNPIEKGIAGLGNLGKSIISLADGVRDWATMAYWEYDLQLNPKTGMNELLPSKKRKITPAAIDKAIDNIARVMTAMIVPVAAFGTLMAGGNLAGGPLAMLGIGKNPIEKGIEGIGNIGKSIASLADGVLKFARMQFVEWDVQKVNGKNELVPKGIIKVDESVINTAIDNIGLVLSAGARAVINFEKELLSGGMFGGFYNTLAKVNDMTNSFGKVYDTIRKIFSDGGALGVVMGNFKYFFEKLFEPLQIEKTMQLLAFNTQFERYINNTLELSKNYTKLDVTLSPMLIIKYDNFTKITERLANIATPFERFVKSFGDMAKHMGVFATNFKVMDPISIKAFKDWTDSMVQISKVDIGKSEGIISFINDSVSAAFGGGSSEKVGDKSPQQYSEADKKNQAASMSKPGESAATAQNQQPAQVDTEAIISAIQQGFSSITVEQMTVLKMKNGI